MTSPDKERGLRLTWTRTPDRGDDGWLTSWTADTTIGSVSAMESGDEFEWFVDSVTGIEHSLLAAQLAAESLYCELTCNALAAFAEPTAIADWGIEHDPSLGTCVEAHGLDKADGFRRLAISLLAASASTKEPPP